MLSLSCCSVIAALIILCLCYSNGKLTDCIFVSNKCQTTVTA